MLPYLELKKQKENDEMLQEVTVPNLVGMPVQEAEKLINELGLEINLEKESEEDTNLEIKNMIIQEQVPMKGIKVNQGTKIILKY